MSHSTVNMCGNNAAANSTLPLQSGTIWRAGVGPQDQGQVQNLLPCHSSASPVGRVFPQALAGSEVLRIILSTGSNISRCCSRTWALAKESKEKIQIALALLFAGAQLILHPGCSCKVTTLPVLASASHPINLETRRLSFPTLN